MMGRFFSGLGKAAGLAAIAVAVYTQKLSSETGRDFMTVLLKLPEELKQSQAEWQKRLEHAVDAGKKAAAEKEAEIERELEDGQQPPQAPPVDYLV